jgi:hypothetical protein
MVTRKDADLIVLKEDVLRVVQVEQNDVVIILVVYYTLGNSRVQIARDCQHPEKALYQKQCGEEACVLLPVEAYAFKGDFQIAANIRQKLTQNITSGFQISDRSLLKSIILL